MNWRPLSALLTLMLAATAHAEGISSRRVGPTFTKPLFAVAPPGDFERLFIVEQKVGDPDLGEPVVGRIVILDLESEEVLDPPFLVISNIGLATEQGVAGLVFHPDYADNGRFFVNYSAPEGTRGTTTVSEFLRSEADPNQAAPNSERVLLTIDQPQSNHNGGWMDFGPDGYLYISTGDGGGADDSADGHTPGIGNSQDTSNLHGNLLRIDVEGDDFPLDPLRNYAIPLDNPFVDEAGADEIWAYGLRNPWRNSFDRETGNLWIADVGQGAREEINFQPADSTGRENYGWRLREGSIETPSGGVGGPEPADHVPPIYDYEHGDGPLQGNSVTGGYVYRGPIQALWGHYFFGDFAKNRIWSFRYDGSTVSGFTDWTEALAPRKAPNTIRQISSFGEDAAGNLYVMEFFGGRLFRIVSDCMDGLDNDEDGKIDYPEDLGCRDSGDTSESIDCSEETDFDEDGIFDGCDNCIEVANPAQIDTDEDGFGNACDGDFDQKLPVVGLPDLLQMRFALGRAVDSDMCPQDTGPLTGADCREFDLDNSLPVIGLPDLLRFRGLLGKPPGPSGLRP